MKRLRAFQSGDTATHYADAADILRVISTLLVACYHIWQQSWINLKFKLFVVEQKIVEPKRSSLAKRCGLSRLKMSEAEAWKILIFQRKF